MSINRNTIGVLKIVLSHSEHLKPFVILLEDKVNIKQKPAPQQELEIEEKLETPGKF